MNDIEGGGGSGLALTMYDVIMSLITMHRLVTRLTAPFICLTGITKTLSSHQSQMGFDIHIFFCNHLTTIQSNISFRLL